MRRILVTTPTLTLLLALTLLLTLTLTLACFPRGAFAKDAKDTPLDHVEALAAYVARDDADFDGGNDLYKAAKEALAEEAEAIAQADARPAAKRYAEIQTLVANKLRRESIPASGWLMGIFGAALLWGGFFFCVALARKKGGAKSAG